jgi:hypothetical protein
VSLFIVINSPKGSDSGVVVEVLSDVDNAKSKCFRKSYLGIPVPKPPFSPLVLHKIMEPVGLTIE